MKRCETCLHWLQQYYSKSYNLEGDFTPDSINVQGEQNHKADYGECKEAVSVYGRENPGSLPEMTKAKRPMLTLDSEEYGGAWLYTHKDHCCKCWKKKQD